VVCVCLWGLVFVSVVVVVVVVLLFVSLGSGLQAWWQLVAEPPSLSVPCWCNVWPELRHFVARIPARVEVLSDDVSWWLTRVQDFAGDDAGCWRIVLRCHSGGAAGCGGWRASGRGALSMVFVLVVLGHGRCGYGALGCVCFMGVGVG
jgi:hypothetical protein